MLAALLLICYALVSSHCWCTALLHLLSVNVALADAMRSRKLPALEKAVAAAEKAGMEKRLGVQLAMARRILEQLRRIEKLRNAIMSLDQPTIAEIKSYSSPPVAVNHVMTATFLLLGESEKRMQVSEILTAIQKYC